ncbi:hypothetical protein [Streptomyces dysideae]|uniref:Uncharacterized protein n=1 Tax=Streptomyces dysideae TaxID=909626 RepID=A0A101V3J3_9ACTN|nr:hypothetical protein [Streptomyces dysideae]KUO21788.1 hypothetical protein AQJ91_06495 [Streptomyces dysideae]
MTLHGLLVTLAVLVVTAGAVMGVAAIRRGWVLPFGRRRVLRPKLWGYGMLVSSVGMTGYMSAGPLDLSLSAYATVAFTGLGVFFVGVILQLLAQRPGRRTTS